MVGVTSTLALLMAAVPAFAQTWYVLQLYTPNSVNITNYRGTMRIPETYPPGYPGSGGTYYLWPGLQGDNTNQNPGVLQSVLSPDSQNGTWSEATGYCCVDGIPWGEGVAMTNGQEFWWNYQINDDHSWTCETGYPGQGAGATDTFQLEPYPFNLAVWAIELYGCDWNFGSIAFYDVYITWLGSDTDGCSNDAVYQEGSFSYAVDGATATVNDDNTVTCYFSQVIFWNPT